MIGSLVDRLVAEGVTGIKQAGEHDREVDPAISAVAIGRVRHSSGSRPVRCAGNGAGPLRVKAVPVGEHQAGVIDQYLSILGAVLLAELEGIAGAVHAIEQVLAIGLPAQANGALEVGFSAAVAGGPILGDTHDGEAGRSEFVGVHVQSIYLTCRQVKYIIP